jgi:hypothetical protein
LERILTFYIYLIGFSLLGVYATPQDLKLKAIRKKERYCHPRILQKKNPNQHVIKTAKPFETWILIHRDIALEFEDDSEYNPPPFPALLSRAAINVAKIGLAQPHDGPEQNRCCRQ